MQVGPGSGDWDRLFRRLTIKPGGNPRPLAETAELPRRCVLKLTIDKKVVLFITMLIIALGAVLGLYFINTETRALNHGLNERGTHLLDDLATELEYPLLVGDKEAMARKVKAVLEETDVVYCRIERKDGSAIYQEGTRPSGPVREFTSPIVTSRNGGAAESLILNVPQEKTEKIGGVVLLLSLTRLNRLMSEVKSTVTSVVTIAIVVASLGVYLLIKRLIGVPVGLLVHATEKIAAGDLGYKVPATMKDELELLGHSFNRMTESLLEAQEELLHREKLAMLGQLAGGLGNELRNPLGVMNNAVFLLKEMLSGEDESVGEYLEIIKNEIDNSHRIISDFIDFFRTKTPRARPVQNGELIGACLEKCTIAENVEVVVDLPETLPPLTVDPLQVMQALGNIIENAVQAMPQGGQVRIRGTAGRAETGGERGDVVEISIEDTGGGIAPENIDKIFQPLFSTKSRGIGLGLSIAKNLIEVNGGRIEVESDFGKGTTFRVLLPAGRGEA